MERAARRLTPVSLELGGIAVAATDINGDHKVDVVVGKGDGVFVLLNATEPGATTANFVAQPDIPLEPYVQSLAVADVNGDGKFDLIAANFNGVSILLNRTSAGADATAFATPQTFPMASAFALATADFDRDGMIDVVATNYEEGTVSVLRNTTARNSDTILFAAPQTFAVGRNPKAVAASDVNHDGRPDLIVANYSDDTVSVLLNTTTSIVQAPALSGMLQILLIITLFGAAAIRGQVLRFPHDYFCKSAGSRRVAATFTTFLLPPGEGGAKRRMRVGSFMIGRSGLA